ncbi:ferritin-like domain-containing protein [Salinimicrobium xinjiangense]|uniref:ferritin-like domain-containing protein n=1 Tax=Salinimicrobium xinjiangense TaxID=438596 RepID=UPI0004044B41|nr:PA2169 family four-helix-bundle protein [Salinimicrobium xinjiangense]
MKTTREAAREENHKDITHSLQDLLEKNYETEKIYRTASDRAENTSLKDFFKKQAVSKNHFATEIDKQLHALNERPKEPDSTMGGVKKTWINLKTSMGKNADEVLLKECLSGEKNSAEEYEDELKKVNFPANIDEMLNSHLAEIRSTITQIRSLEDLL